MEENQLESPNLEHVAVVEPTRLDSVAVKVGAVKGTGVFHPVAATGPLHLNVSSGDRHVVEKDVCRTMAAYGGQIGL